MSVYDRPIHLCDLDIHAYGSIYTPYRLGYDPYRNNYALHIVDMRSGGVSLDCDRSVYDFYR